MQNLTGIGAYGTVGLDFAVAVAIGTYGGWWLDEKLGWTPWLTLVGLLFGVAAGFNVLYKAAKRMKEETEREEKGQRALERSENGSEKDHGTHDHGNDDAS